MVMIAIGLTLAACVLLGILLGDIFDGVDRYDHEMDPARKLPQSGRQDDLF